MFVFSCVRLTVPGPHCCNNNTPPPSCISINPEVLVGIGHLKKSVPWLRVCGPLPFLEGGRLDGRGKRSEKSRIHCCQLEHNAISISPDAVAEKCAFLRESISESVGSSKSLSVEDFFLKKRKAFFLPTFRPFFGLA